MIVDPAFMAEVEDAVAGASSERRGEMLRKATDLFVSDWEEFTSEELSIFDNVIVRLAAEIEQAARELLAKRGQGPRIRGRKSLHRNCRRCPAPPPDLRVRPIRR